jgi:clan AA aspartic protease (TIGR02281 family)
VTIGLWLAMSASVAPAAAADNAPEDVLWSKGLSKFGAYYVLDPDAKLGDLLRATTAAGKKYTDAKKRHSTLESNLKEAVATLQNLDAQNQQQTSILDQISKSANGNYNHQVHIVNDIRTKLRQYIAAADELQKTFAADPEPSDAEYVADVVKLSDTMEQANRRYQALAADPEVKSALERLNQMVKPPAKLGPSPRFAEQLPVVRRLRDKVAPTGLRFDMIGGVPEVPVTVNDAVKEDMIVDNAAPYMCITQATADKLGLKPDASAKTVRVAGSEGQAVEARLVVLKTVQLGDFAVANVECAIAPDSMMGAKNILGKSVLKHFVYRIDLPNGMLHLSQLDGAPISFPSSPSSNSSGPPAIRNPDAPPVKIVSARWGGVTPFTPSPSGRGPG